MSTSAPLNTSFIKLFIIVSVAILQRRRKSLHVWTHMHYIHIHPHMFKHKLICMSCVMLVQAVDFRCNPVSFSVSNNSFFENIASQHLAFQNKQLAHLCRKFIKGLCTLFKRLSWMHEIYFCFCFALPITHSRTPIEMQNKLFIVFFMDIS